MKKEIIPAVLVKDRKSLLKQLRSLERYFPKAQIDIADGIFVPNKTIDPSALKGVKTRMKLEFHLMVRNHIRSVYSVFENAKPYAVIVHAESVHPHQMFRVISYIKHHGAKAGLALNPETSVNKIKPYLKMIDQVTVMTVHPGFMGRKFVKNAINKIKNIRKLNKHIDIEVDGGINPDTIKLASKAGANLFVVGSYMQNSKDIRKSIRELKANV